MDRGLADCWLISARKRGACAAGRNAADCLFDERDSSV
jgi:hypothetical protein